MLRWPERIEESIEDFLARVGQVVRTFGERTDSRSAVVGVETAAGRFIVKHATDPEAIGWLESAIRFHGAVQHPAIPTIVHSMATRDGLAVVEEWAPGEVLVDQFDPAIPGRDDPRSPYRRLLGLPADEIVAAVRQLIDAHATVAAVGFVAVDLYDGCLLYDFDTGHLSLIDLDMYRPGPYVLTSDRQHGSRSFMAPEEWRRGASIDERTTVFTLGRLALVLLGCSRQGQPERGAFRGDDHRFAVATRACSSKPTDRYQSVRDLGQAWR